MVSEMSEGWQYVTGWHGPRMAERLWRNEALGIERLLITKRKGYEGEWKIGVFYERKIGAPESAWIKIEP